jgi:hypothetical protein
VNTVEDTVAVFEAKLREQFEQVLSAGPIPYSDEGIALFAQAYAEVEAKLTPEQREARDQFIAAMTPEDVDRLMARAIRPVQPVDLDPAFAGMVFAKAPAIKLAPRRKRPRRVARKIANRYHLARYCDVPRSLHCLYCSPDPVLDGWPDDAQELLAALTEAGLLLRLATGNPAPCNWSPEQWPAPAHRRVSAL